jgi:nucleoside-diphosphate-sugar epimerase
VPDALLTGGGGFLGRHLTKLLLERGWRVAHWVHRAPAAPRSAVELFLEPPPPPRRFDVVFLLAAAGVEPGARAQDVLQEGNICAPAAALGTLAGQAGRFVAAGSWMEYAPTAPGRRWREDDPLGGSEIYGASKAAGGLWLAGVARLLGIPLVRLRLFQLYGAGEAPHRLLASLERKLRAGQETPLSPGGQVRDFVHVEDAAEALLASTAETVPPGEAYNVCSGEPVTVADFARAAARALNAPERLLRWGALPYRPGELMWAVGDPARFHAATSWRPRFDLAAGLDAVLRVSHV